MFLEIDNPSAWAAQDVRLEVRHRDGSVDKDSRERVNPTRQGEPRWTVLLRGVKPANVDVFAEVRQRIESAVLTFRDEREIARYRVRIPTNKGVGEPFDVTLAEEERIR